MTLNAAIESGALSDLRTEATARMTSTAAVRRLTGRTTQNESSGREVPEWTDVYDGPFRYVGGGTKRITVGGVEFQEASGRADFPWDTTGLADGDLIDITAGQWVGKVLRVIDVEAGQGDDRTAFRVPVQTTTRPKEWV